MEDMVNVENLFGGVYKGKKVLITGHTGFKGAWLAHWLEMMGAEVYAYALAPDTEPSHYKILNTKIRETYSDITDTDSLNQFFNEAQPHIVFHLAAQALVRDSYNDPITTFNSNVMGTLCVYEAARKTPSVRAIVNVTSDKCYENKEWTWGYRENDPMGGYDPYSASKGCAELLTSSYRNSYFKDGNGVLLASVRAGNVIGGGDWAKDRLIPDIVRATSLGKKVQIRNPKATRPWQHVLEPLSGYLMVGWKLLLGEKEYADGWNFGPDLMSNLTVGEIVELCKTYWDEIGVELNTDPNQVHEAHLLMLDCSKANKIIKWKPVWGIHETLKHTISWYKNYYQNNTVDTFSDIHAFITAAHKNRVAWAN